MSKQKRARYIAWVVSAMLGAVALFLYFKKQDDNVGSSNSHQLEVGYIPISDCAQLFVAKYNGEFSKHGVDVTLVPMASGSAILQALSAGAIDVAFSNLASVVFYERNGTRLTTLRGGTKMNSEYSEAGLVVRSESGIKSVGGLANKKIAVNAVRNMVDVAVRRTLRKGGVNPDEVEILEIPFKDMEAALRANRVDAIALAEPYLSQAKKNGGLTSLGDHFALAFGELYSTGYFALPSAYAGNRAAFDLFSDAMTSVTPLTNEYNESVVTAISSITKVSTEDLRNAGRPWFILTLPDSARDNMFEWLVEERFIER